MLVRKGAVCGCVAFFVCVRVCNCVCEMEESSAYTASTLSLTSHRYAWILLCANFRSCYVGNSPKFANMKTLKGRVQTYSSSPESV